MTAKPAPARRAAAARTVAAVRAVARRAAETRPLREVDELEPGTARARRAVGARGAVAAVTAGRAAAKDCRRRSCRAPRLVGAVYVGLARGARAQHRCRRSRGRVRDRDRLGGVEIADAVASVKSVQPALPHGASRRVVAERE